MTAFFKNHLCNREHIGKYAKKCVFFAFLPYFHPPLKFLNKKLPLTTKYDPFRVQNRKTISAKCYYLLMLRGLMGLI